MRLFFYASFAMMVLSMPAYAVSIKNLSGEVQSLRFRQMEQTREIDLQPYEQKVISGAGVFLLTPSGHAIHTNPLDQYAIWPDGTLAIQKRPNSRQNGL